MSSGNYSRGFYIVVYAFYFLSVYCCQQENANNIHILFPTLWDQNKKLQIRGGQYMANFHVKIFMFQNVLRILLFILQKH